MNLIIFQMDNITTLKAAGGERGGMNTNPSNLWTQYSKALDYIPSVQGSGGHGMRERSANKF